MLNINFSTQTITVALRLDMRLSLKLALEKIYTNRNGAVDILIFLGIKNVIWITTVYVHRSVKVEPQGTLT